MQKTPLLEEEEEEEEHSQIPITGLHSDVMTMMVMMTAQTHSPGAERGLHLLATVMSQ